ncbi:MAG: TRAP transporter small permease [Desulfobacterales bacterium]|nr:MAG: TRAP transporter small permease [Desulfobacterales bacterium]
MGTLRDMQRRWDFLSAKVNTGVSWICIVLIIFMTVEVIVAVFFRYALDAPIKWGEELARLVMVWAGLLGISIALREGEHIGLEVLTARLSGRVLAGCNLAAHGLVGLFLVVLLVWGIQIAQAAWGTFLPALQIKWTWSHLAVPVTAGIQLIHLVSMLLGDAVDILEPEGPIAGAGLGGASD